MTERRLGAAGATCSACSSTARRSPRRTRSGERGRRRLVPAAVQRAPRGRRVHAAADAASARAGRSCCAPPTRTPRPARCTASAGERRRLLATVAGAAAARRMTELPRDLPAAARRRLRLRRRRASSCPTCATSASRTSTCRRRSRRARAPRTATTSSTRRAISDELGGEEEFARWRRAARDAGLGLVLDIVPNHMATDDANRYWADPALRAQFFDIDEETGRHRRFFDIDHLAARAPGGPGGLRGDAPAGAAAGARGRRRRAADRPSRRARRPGRLPASGCATAAREHVWVEKILDPGEQLRDWPVEGTVGYEFLNDVAALFVDPAGEAPLTACGSSCPATSGRSASARSRPSSSRRATTFAPEVDAAARARRRARSTGSSARSPRCRSTAPTSSRGRAASRTPTARRSREAGLPESLARVLLLERARLGRVRHALPADDAAGDGQGRRGHGVLPLRAAAGAQRRRRRPGPLRHRRSTTSTRRTPSARERFPRNLLVTQTHDTKRSGDVRARIGALAGDGGGVGGARAALARGVLAAARRRADAGRAATSSSRRCVGAWPIERRAARRRTSRRRCARPSATRTGSSPTRRTRRRVQGVLPRAARRTAPFLRDFEPFAARGRRAPATAPRSASCC